MSKRKKYRKTDQEDLLRYSSNGLSEEKRHKVEREAQQDPFLEDALDGYASISHEEALKDLSSLQSKIERRTGTRRTVVWTRIAASVAVLLTIGTVYLTVFTDRFGQVDRTVAEAEKSEMPEEKEELDLAGIDDTSLVQEQVAPGPAVEEIPAVETETSPPVEEQVFMMEETIALADEAASSLDTLNIGAGAGSESIIADVSDDMQEEPEITGQDITMAEEEVREEETGVTEDLNIPAETRARQSDIAQPAALEGIPATKSAKKARAAGEGSTIVFVREAADSIPSLPVGGLEAFRLYIEQNIDIPEGDSVAQMALLSFFIGSGGRPASIELEESSSDNFGRETIRLLSEGPAWEPAYEGTAPLARKNQLRIEYSKQ